MSSQFPKPTMACKHCGKNWESHGNYCHPILDKTLIISLILLGILVVFVFFLLMFI